MNEMDTGAALAQRAILKAHRKRLWGPFIAAARQYALIRPHDRILVEVELDPSSVLLGRLMAELQRHSEFPFEVVFTAEKDLDALQPFFPEGLLNPHELDGAAFTARTSLECMDDAAETVLRGMLLEGKLQGMRPMEPPLTGTARLIRPLLRIRRRDIALFGRYCRLEAMPISNGDPGILGLMEELEDENPEITQNIFQATHLLHLDTLIWEAEDGGR